MEQEPTTELEPVDETPPTVGVVDSTEAGKKPSTRPCLTPEGKIWPASISIYPDHYYCSKFTKNRVAGLIAEQLIPEDDGKMLDVWVLTKIDHWDHDQECTICLTDRFLLMISLSFITEQIQSVQRIPVSSIHTLRLGNLVTPHWSLLPERQYGAIQLIWGPLASTKWTARWNPLSKDVPAAIFHHHPCYYAVKPLADRELFDCDNMAGRLREILDIYAVQPVHENIVLNARFNPFSVFYNQSNLGFCKDRNGVSF